MSAFLAVTTTTTFPPSAIRGYYFQVGSGGRDWWEVASAIGALVAAGTGLWLVYSLRRTHAYCEFARASWVENVTGIVHIVAAVHIVPGGPSWVRKRYSASFKANGVELDVVPRAEIPRQSGSEYRKDLVYEMPDPNAPIDVDIRVAFLHGGSARLSQRVDRPS